MAPWAQRLAVSAACCSTIRSPALLGGAAGAAAGALTDEDQINLGKPVWK